MTTPTLTHLKQLEHESIHVMREVVAECQNPVMLYSVGKDSAVMLRLAQKAFHPGRFPFPLLRPGLLTRHVHRIPAVLTPTPARLIAVDTSRML